VKKQKPNIIKASPPVTSDAELKAAEIIALAQDKAKDILASAEKIKKETESKSADLSNQIIDFKAEKVANETELRRRTNEANGLMSAANELQKELNDKEANYNARLAKVVRREEALRTKVV